ncbi:MAG: hypothetical protein ACI30C_08110 [Muribaculaceae bacterium]
MGSPLGAPGMSPRPAWLNTRLRTAATPAGVTEIPPLGIVFAGGGSCRRCAA